MATGRQGSPCVSVIIPVHNGGATFRKAARAAMAGLGEGDELLIVDDGGTDGSGDFARSLGARVIATPRPASGPAAARNLAARHASGDVLLFLDADVLAPRQTVEKVRRFFVENPGHAAVMGNYDKRPPERNLLSQYKNLLQHFVHARAAEETFTFWGAVGGIRREAFEAVGGFDEARYHVPCIEDIELGARLAAAGSRIRLKKDLQVRHMKRWTALSLLKSDVVRRALPWTELILERTGMKNDLNIDRAARAKVLLSGVAVAGGPVAAAIGAPVAAAALVPVVALAVMAALDAALLRFFWRERGPGFAAAAFAWHAFSYFYSGAAFAAGLARHAWRKATAGGAHRRMEAAT